MTNPLLNRQFEIVREDMHRRYGSLHSADHIDALVDATIAERTAAAKVETFLPVIVERIVSETLEEQATAAGAKDPRARREVLYVCERNAGRSQLASAITSGVGKSRNRAGVMRFTRLSVHCALRMTATNSWKGFS